MENGKIRIALIATYPKMSKMFISMAAENDIAATSVYASFEDAVRMAHEMENEVDAIISRGGTGLMLKQEIEKPVINVPITPFDVLKGLEELKDLDVHEVAFIHSEDIGEIDAVEKMTGIRIREYSFSSRDDIRDAVEEVKKLGIKVVVGGQVGARYAEQVGLRGIEISAGEDSMLRAIKEAIHIVELNEFERSKSAQIRAAFDSISEAIVVTDASGEVRMTNSRAKKLFEKEEIAMGDFNDVDFSYVFNGDFVEQSKVKQINKRSIAVTHRRVVENSRFSGVISTFEDVGKIQRLEKKIRNELHKKGFVAKHNFDDIISKSPKMEEAKRKAALYAGSDSSILIEGESGTGKELFAQSIHTASERRNGPFVAINCAAIPANLLESELFGYEPGAFTGASKDGKLGLFEMAHEGTIFLDEISELPIELQSRILRVLQEREVMRIGGDKIVPVDIRVLSATNRDLREMVEDKTFREDLYYRLNVFNVVLPPLRNRKEDIEILLRHFFKSMDCELSDETIKTICARVSAYDWPGNIRELQNVAERTSVLRDMIEGAVKADSAGLVELLGLRESKEKKVGDFSYNLDGGLKGAVADIEKQIIAHLMDELGGDQDAVTQKLQIGRTTLWRKIKGEEDEK